VIDVLLVLNLGIIGYRNHAAKLISYIEERSDCKINFIYHPTKQLEDKRFTNNFSDLYSCDAVVISSPNHTHFEYIKKLTKNYNGYIFCEKPPVTNYNELEKLNNLPSNQKQRIFFDFVFRFSNLNDLIKQEICSEELGQIIHIDIFSSKGLAFKKEYADSWRADGKNNLHNILDAYTIHYVDLINLHLGKIDKSFYLPSLVSKKGTSYDTSYVVLRYENDVTLSIFNSYSTPLINEISIIGTNGHLTIRNNQLLIHSPRDTFDKDGLFTDPPINRSLNFNLSEDGENSLRKSLDFFINKVQTKEEIPIEYFDTSVTTNRIILQCKELGNKN
jgi:predicted dehydrogenase